jgi:hypothetical protein
MWVAMSFLSKEEVNATCGKGMYIKIILLSWVLWCTPVIIALGRQSQEDFRVQAQLRLHSESLSQKTTTKIFIFFPM